MYQQSTMMATFAISLLVMLSALCPSSALPSQRLARVSEDPNANIVGVASNILAADVLRAYAANNSNFVFSPLGFSSILAILGEGARGETAARLNAALHHPEDRQRVREAYRTALGRLQGDSAVVAPQFKTWLYIYRNNTARDEFQQTLRNDYHVEVKEIDRYDSLGWGSDDAPTVANIDPTITLEPLSELNAQPTSVSVVELATADADNNSKDIPEFDSLKINAADETRRIDDQRDASKFDEVVEDKQYVEVPVIREEIAAQQMDDAENGNRVIVDQVKEAIVADNNQYVPESVVTVQTLRDTKEQIKDSVAARDLDDMEIMVAQASSSRRFAAREFGNHGAGEVASVISGNSIVGKKEASADNESKLILFNGLYYRGSWAAPFQQLRSEAGNVFYKSDTEKCTVHMMRARGQYRYARLQEARAQAIELPYDNARYAMLLIVPNSRNGLASLLSQFTAQSVAKATAQLSAQPIDLSLPKFSVETTGGIEKILAAAPQSPSSLAAMFTEAADFSGISDTEQRLHVDELQQHVSVRVDEGASSESFLTATNAQRSAATASTSSSLQPDEAAAEQLAVVVDRPFLFFVRDVVDDVLIVAGKVVQPPPSDGPASLLLD